MSSRYLVHVRRAMGGGGSTGSITVKADSESEAKQKALEEYRKRYSSGDSYSVVKIEKLG